ncbi:MAG: LPXTG cell wall anchor domain-containing protein [Aeromicrobium sp.]|uniref:LPXTG cell wall anchor domain-containing protein n=1 Tax=Aeromicrobium sp. TaxID=1871063 RepID=UPI0039E26517
MLNPDPRAGRGGRRPVVSRLLVVLAFVASVLSVQMSVSAAQAEVTRVAGIAHANTYMGIEDFHGSYGVCSGNGHAVPTYLTPATAVYAPNSAWALNNYATAGVDNVTAAAVAYIVKTDSAVPNNHENSTPDVGVGERVQQILAEAAAWGGDRSIPLTVSDASNGGGLRWTLDGVGVQAAGGWMPGRSMTLTIDGPVVFDATGTNSMTVTSGSSAQSFALTSTGNGLFTVSAAAEVPSNYVDSHAAEGAGYQIVTTVHAGNDQLNGATDPQMAVHDFAIDISTQVEQVVLDADSGAAALVDGLSFSAAEGDEWIEVDIDGVLTPVPVLFEADVYGPYLEESAPEADVPVDDEVACRMEYLAENGPEEGVRITSDDCGDLVGGIYTIHWKVVKANQGDYAQYIRDDASDGWFTLGETVVKKYQWTHFSMAREWNVDADGRHMDTYTIGGFPENHGDWEGGDFEGSVIGPDRDDALITVYDMGPKDKYKGTKIPTEVPAGTPVHWSQVVPAKNGVYEIGYDDENPVTGFTEGHCYVGVYSFDGDDRVEAGTSSFADVKQRFCVSGGVLTPVTSPAAASGGGLPSTGAPVSLLAVLAAGVAAGGGVIVLRRFRHGMTA